MPLLNCIMGVFVNIYVPNGAHLFTLTPVFLAVYIYAVYILDNHIVISLASVQPGQL